MGPGDRIFPVLSSSRASLSDLRAHSHSNFGMSRLLTDEGAGGEITHWVIPFLSLPMIGLP